MRNSIWTLAALCVGLFGLIGCGGDACVSRCAQGKDMGCVNESVDCESTCDDIDMARVDARANAEVAGCTAEFDTLVSCSDGRPACDTTGCESETSALADCTIAFCTANPMSEACAAP